MALTEILLCSHHGNGYYVRNRPKRWFPVFSAWHMDYRESESKRTEIAILESRDSLGRMKLQGVRRRHRQDSRCVKGWCGELGGPAGEVGPRKIPSMLESLCTSLEDPQDLTCVVATFLLL